MKSLNEVMSKTLEERRLFQKWTRQEERLTSLLNEKEEHSRKLLGSLDPQLLQTINLKTLSAMEMLDQADAPADAAVVLRLLQSQEVLRSTEEVKHEYSMYAHHKSRIQENLGDYDEMLEMKNALIQDAETVWSEALYEAAGKEIHALGLQQEAAEAAEAGEDAYYATEDVLKSISRAADTAMNLPDKHPLVAYLRETNADDTKERLHRLERLIRQFENELADISLHPACPDFSSDSKIKSESLFDEIMSEWIFERNLQQSVDKLTRLQEHVSDTVNEIKEYMQTLEQTRRELSEARIKLLSRA
ncbi:hypothetical protein [Alkalicoccus chagannorensis]|uniref:hypothetical protein n=1 Tax=Alkalicoccus chagannorensis TaxID=427072 RepID=UPI00040D7B8C|nr:hypothetical protein [Alkalicoccus chagannorensis]